MSSKQDLEDERAMLVEEIAQFQEVIREKSERLRLVRIELSRLQEVR